MALGTWYTFSPFCYCVIILPKPLYLPGLPMNVSSFADDAYMNVILDEEVEREIPQVLEDEITNSTPGELEHKSVTVHRSNLMKELMKIFEDITILNTNLYITLIDHRG